MLNDGLSIDLDTISRELVNGLPHELSDSRASDRCWTKAVFDGLRTMGRQQGLLVCCHGSEDQGEWLLDVVWMNRDTWRIVLAVESEWGRLAAIEEDLGKLMSIKSRHKLLLFSTDSHVGAEGIVTALEKMMLAYPDHLVGEEYLLLEVTVPGAYRYSFSVRSEGLLESVKFGQMGGLLRWPWAK